MIRPRPGMMTLCAAALLAAAVIQPATAAPDGALRLVDRIPTDAAIRVLDARAQTACEKASLPGARCLPAADLFDADGKPVGFHTLRWLLGTIGLSGREPVLVVAANAGDAAAVGALLFLAGQRAVAILDGPLTLPADAAGGSGRNLTREAVFTAAMRDRLLVAAPEHASGDVISSGAPKDRLRRFARSTAGGAPAQRLRLTP